MKSFEVSCSEVTVAQYEIAQNENGRVVERMIKKYNLD